MFFSTSAPLLLTAAGSIATIPLAASGIVFPDIEPVLIEIGPVAIRWYALSYILGILLGWWYLGKLNSPKYKVLSQRAYDDIILWIIGGIMIGGRLGYILFYNLDHYIQYPTEFIAVWRGGMSFHGGLLGVIMALFLMCKWHRLHFLSVTDRVACVAPIGLLLGRIANFINAELYGRATDAPWGVIFPGEHFARHPSQLYEAFFEGLILLAIMALLFYRTSARNYAGRLSGTFLLGYATARFCIEFFREPDPQLGFLFAGATMGQLLSVPMGLFGLYLILKSKPVTLPLIEEDKEDDKEDKPKNLRFGRKRKHYDEDEDFS